GEAGNHLRGVPAADIDDAVRPLRRLVRMDGDRGGGVGDGAEKKHRSVILSRRRTAKDLKLRSPTRSPCYSTTLRSLRSFAALRRLRMTAESATLRAP